MAENAGRIPPNNKEAESALLGAVLLRNKVLDDVQALLRPEDFYVRSNGILWNGILMLRNEKPGVTIDMVSLSTFLAGKGMLQDCGGVAYISSLTNLVPAAANAAYYAQIIKECSRKRQLLELSVLIGDSAFDETQNVKASIDVIDQKLSELATNSSTSNYSASGSFLWPLIDDIHMRMDGRKAAGLSSGFRSLDRILGGGFKKEDLIILGARPSVGKTAFALSIAHNMAFRGNDHIKVGFFSLEMSGPSLMERLLSRESSIDSNILRNNKVPESLNDDIMKASARMYDLSENLLIQDTPNISLMEIRSQARRMVNNDGVQIIFVDYIGLITPDGSLSKPRHEQISEISRALKSLARELHVPVICLSQVNRDAGKDRAPMLSDLRESGSIEQDADVVLLLDDPSKRLDENNKVKQYEEDAAAEAEGSADLDPRNNRKIKVIVAKQRNGQTGAFDMLFRSCYVSFEDIEKRQGL